MADDLYVGEGTENLETESLQDGDAYARVPRGLLVPMDFAPKGTTWDDGLPRLYIQVGDAYYLSDE